MLSKLTRTSTNLLTIVSRQITAVSYLSNTAAAQETEDYTFRKEGNDPIPQNEKSPVWSCNEWDPLEEIIVGRPDNAVIAPLWPEAKACLEPFKYPFYEKNGGKYWRDVVDKDMWDLLVKQSEGYAKMLEFYGVKVTRPDKHDFGVQYTTPTFGPTPGHDASMARDHIMVVGDEIIEASMSWRYRYFEFIPFRNIILDYWRRGGRWTQAPKPTLEPGLMVEDYSEGKTLEERYKMTDTWVTTEKEISWDAADFLRYGRDIIGQRSQATNRAGIEWLRRYLAPKGVRVHELPIDLAFNLHIDVLLSAIGPGVMMVNADIKFPDLSLFENAGWKIIKAPKPSTPFDDPVWKMTAAYPWISINTLFLDQKHVFVDSKETELHKFYEKWGITPIPVPFHGTKWLGGGLHCWTSDIRRRGPMLNYF